MAKRTTEDIIDLTQEEEEQEPKKKTKTEQPWILDLIQQLNTLYPPVPEEQEDQYPYSKPSKPQMESSTQFDETYYKPLKQFLAKQEQNVKQGADPNTIAIQTLQHTKNLLINCQHSVIDDLQFDTFLHLTAAAILAFGLAAKGQLPQSLLDHFTEIVEEDQGTIQDAISDTLFSFGNDSYTPDEILQAFTPAYKIIKGREPAFLFEFNHGYQQNYKQILKLPYTPDRWIDTSLTLNIIAQENVTRGLPQEAYTLVIDQALKQFN